MSNNTRSRISRTRAKLISWGNSQRKKLILYVGLTAIFSVSVILLSFAFKSRLLHAEESLAIKESNLDTEVSIYDKSTEKVDLGKIDTTVEDITATAIQPATVTNEKKPSDTKISINILGELMMGGAVTKNLNYSYASAFKEIYNQTRSSDFTYATFGTNITNLNTLNIETKSKYLVTKDVVNAMNALGIDSLNVATDHMIDYSNTIFRTTLDILNKNDIYAAGLDNQTVYLEKADKKVAIVATNNVLIGTASNYSEYGISTYNESKMISQIIEAKENSDFVIVDIHWGRSYLFGVTEQMKTIAKKAIDAGANLIIGSNALGIYPITEYKGVPIIYSTGYLMSDSEEYLAKESGIFEVNISKDNKVENIKITPIYVKDFKEAVYYSSYSYDYFSGFVEQLNRWNVENGLKSKIENGTIVVEF